MMNFWYVVFQHWLALLNNMQQVERVVRYEDDLAVWLRGNSRIEIQNKAKQIIEEMTS